MRRIPASGINLFQLIYILIREYEARTGARCLNLSLGNPDITPDPRILALKKRFADGVDYDLHTYAEDKNLNGFAEGMVEAFSGLRLAEHPSLRVIPIGGIKTATAILPLSCGLHLAGGTGSGLSSRADFSVVTHLPAYDVMGTWSTSYYGGRRIVWPLESRSGMRMDVAALRRAIESAGGAAPALIFVIRPGNPASAGASETEWRELIEFCLERKIRLANDGAYATLSEGILGENFPSLAGKAARSSTAGAHVPLSRVACEYPDLEWMELFSVSKSFSDPGQRLGVAVGSKDWIEDFILMKGNTDSGPVPLGMMAYGELFKDQKLTREILQETYQIYRRRLDFLIPALKGIGLRPACETTSGFFTLWQVPDEAFGVSIDEEARSRGCSRAEAFNRMVIDRTGIVGVHFTGPAASPGSAGEAYIRYAVCSDVLASEFQTRFGAEVAKIQPRYRG